MYPIPTVCLMSGRFFPEIVTRIWKVYSFAGLEWVASLHPMALIPPFSFNFPVLYCIT